MVTTQKIVVSNERWVLNAEKATFTSPEGDVNISEGTNAPYAVLKFRDKNNPFSQTELTYIHKAPSILKGETIVYSADPTTAVQEAKANGYIMPKTLIAAVKNLSAQNQPTLDKLQRM